VRYTFADMPAKTSSGVRFVAASDQSLLVYFGEQESHHPGLKGAAKKRGEASGPASKAAAQQRSISPDEHAQVRRLLHVLELEPIAGVKNLHPAYSSVLVKFDALKLRHEELEEILRRCVTRLEKVELPESRTVEIPVCYGGEFGPDLQDVAELHGLTAAQVVELHASTIYNVYFLGFTPGFAYLGELPEELVTPRLATPRRSVPAGSVGIAGSQTGVYPISTPGGWRLLGRTPMAMFQPDRAAMNLVTIGDRVRFVPISPEQFAAMEKA
jgi:inhibitor of KinA